MKTCPNCFKEIDVRSKFCGYCGVNIDDFEKSRLNKVYAFGVFLAFIFILVISISFICVNEQYYKGCKSLQEYLIVHDVSGTDLYNTMENIKRADELGLWAPEHVKQYASDFLGEDVGNMIQYNDNGKLVVHFKGKNFTMKDIVKELDLSVKVDEKTDISSGILIRETGKGLLY